MKRTSNKQSYHNLFITPESCTVQGKQLHITLGINPQFVGSLSFTTTARRIR